MAKRSDAESVGCGVLFLLGLILVVLSWLSNYITWYGVGVLLIVFVALIIWGLVKYNSVSTPRAQDLMASYHRIAYMSGGQFEVFTSQVLSAMGYSTRILGGSGDQGVDIIAAGSGRRIAVQCKNYSRAVGNKPVQEVYAGARHHNCTEAWVVAPKGYTRGAIELARSVSVELFDDNSIRQWIKAVDAAESQAQEQVERNSKQSDKRNDDTFKPLEL